MEETKGEGRFAKRRKVTRRQDDEVVQLSPGAFLISAVQFSLKKKKKTLTIYNLEVRVSL